MDSNMSIADSLSQLIGGVNATAQTRLEALFLAVHAVFLRHSFITIVEEANPTPGFAPSLKELPKSTLPSTWRSDLSLQYKHRRAPGKILSFKITELDENTIILTISLRKGDYASVELDLTHYTSSTQPPTPSNLRELHDRVRAVAAQLLPGVLDNPTPTPGPVYPPPLTNPPSLSFPASNPRPYYPPANPYNAGAADLDPFISQGPPHPYPLGPFPPGGVMGGSGGNLIGPDHNIFTGGGDYGPGYPQPYPQPGVPFLPGMTYPTPRFDPYGPPVPFNSDVDVGDVWPEGFDPRGFLVGGRGGRGAGRGAGRGPGRGGAGRGWGGAGAGEPNPDHMRPPGW